MKKLLFPVLIVSLSIAISCEKEENTDIVYPGEGAYGVNILSKDSVEIEATNPNSMIYHYHSMRAELPENTSLKIIISKSGDSWSVELSSMIGWSKSNISTNKTQLLAYGPVVCEAQVVFYGSGNADIEFYENDSEEPDRVKTISWEY